MAYYEIKVLTMQKCCLNYFKYIFAVKVNVDKSKFEQ